MADKEYLYIKTTNNVKESKFVMTKKNDAGEYENVKDKDGNDIPMMNVSLTAKQMEKLGHPITSEPKQYAQLSVPAYAVSDWKKKDGTVASYTDDKGNVHLGHEIRLEAGKDQYISISEVVGEKDGKKQYDYKKNPKVKVTTEDLAAVFALPDKNKDKGQDAEADKAADVEPEAPELD